MQDFGAIMFVGGVFVVGVVFTLSVIFTVVPDRVLLKVAKFLGF